MKALPTQKRALLKRSALIDAAVFEFSKQGFERATAKSIALKAGVATGTFYHYFENKNEILRVIAEKRNDELRKLLGWRALQPLDGALKDRASSYSFESISKNPQKIEALFKQNLSLTYEFHSSNPELHQVLEHRRTLDEKLELVMDEGDKVLLERTLVLVKSFNLEEPEVVAQNLFAMGEGIVHRHVFYDSELDAELVISVGAKMLAEFFIKV